MANKSGTKTLSDKLAELANPTPQFVDPEDEYNEGSSTIVSWIVSKLFDIDLTPYRNESTIGPL